MTVELKPETERLVREEISNGHFHSVDELIVESVQAWREKRQANLPLKPHKSIFDLITQPPFAGSELNLERQKDYPRPIDL